MPNQETTITREQARKVVQQFVDEAVKLTAELNKTRRELETEMYCKNKAYFFILSRGLLNDFAQFCKENDNTDPMDGCRQALSGQCK